MTEDEVNLKVREWLENHSFHYKGILNTRDGNSNQRKSERYKPSQYITRYGTATNQAYNSKETGYGQVPVPLPDGSRSILIDHQGISDKYPPKLVWVEAKGSDNNLSELLEGFIRLCAAIYWGGGNGYLAVPNAEYEKLIEQREFLEAVAHSVNGRGQMGLLDVEKQTEVIL